MVTKWRALALLAALHACTALPEAVYHNQYAVHVPAGPNHVDDIARRHGYVNHGQVRLSVLLLSPLFSCVPYLTTYLALNVNEDSKSKTLRDRVSIKKVGNDRYRYVGRFSIHKYSYVIV